MGCCWCPSRRSVSQGGWSKVMRIRFERTGGFANVPLKADLDASEMPPERAQELKKLVEEARPFDQPAQPSSTPTTPDDLQYKMTIEHEGRTHTIRTGDAAAPDELKLLYDFL